MAEVEKSVTAVPDSLAVDGDEICFRSFKSEADLLIVMGMMIEQLSEPYPIYTYRYFV